MRGGDGNDRIRTADGEADLVNCGNGKDRAFLDTADVIEDATAENPNGSCERVLRVTPNPNENAQENATEQQPGGSDQAPEGETGTPSK